MFFATLNFFDQSEDRKVIRDQSEIRKNGGKTHRLPWVALSFLCVCHYRIDDWVLFVSCMDLYAWTKKYIQNICRHTISKKNATSCDCKQKCTEYFIRTENIVSKNNWGSSFFCNFLRRYHHAWFYFKSSCRTAVRARAGNWVLPTYYSSECFAQKCVRTPSFHILSAYLGARTPTPSCTSVLFFQLW